MNSRTDMKVTDMQLERRRRLALFPGCAQLNLHPGVRGFFKDSQGALYINMKYIHFIIVGCSEADLTGENRTLNAPRCADRGFVNSSFISGGEVCYNGAIAGSTAVYICNDGLVLVGNEVRVCQSDGNWNGSIPQCSPEEPGMYFLHARFTSEST